ncbi:hypothetical protein [Massilia brevitalea]|uniref:hypothetical protein n=1 Tax=Massilia brevitalea TaxID=442526 RepID=UPI0027394B01|nr:hypothetical protein [Massilia brevitalea]
MNKFFRTLCIAALAAPLASLAANVTSDTWTLVHTDESGKKYFIIEKTAFTRGELRRIDFQVEHPNLVPLEAFTRPDKSLKHVKTFTYGVWFDCKKHMVRMFNFAAYDKDDRWVDSYYTDKQTMGPVSKSGTAYPAMVAGCALAIPPERQNQ